MHAVKCNSQNSTNRVRPFSYVMTESDHAARERWAQSKLKRMLAHRQGRNAFTEVVLQARKNFLDDDAIRAGAEDGRFYTTCALVAREANTRSPEVVQALRAAWVACHEARRHAAYRSSGCTWAALVDRPSTASPRLTAAVMTLGPASFRTMIRKLYLSMKQGARDYAIDSIDCMRSIRYSAEPVPSRALLDGNEPLPSPQTCTLRRGRDRLPAIHQRRLGARLGP